MSERQFCCWYWALMSGGARRSLLESQDVFVQAAVRAPESPLFHHQLRPGVLMNGSVCVHPFDSTIIFCLNEKKGLPQRKR